MSVATVEKLSPYDYQEAHIEQITTEPSKSALIASAMGSGKTLLASEVVIRLGLKRVLFCGVKDTFAQWRDRLAAQSDGELRLRRMDATKAGELAFAEFLAGVAGHYFVGSQFLTTRDWEQVPALDVDGNRQWKKTTNDPDDPTLLLVENPQIGPRLLPVLVTKAQQKKIYLKMAPVEMIVFDEVHVIANRKSAGRKTVASIKTEWRLAMSGTFAGNKFENAWSITRWLWKELIPGNFGNWKQEWCTTQTIHLPRGASTEKVTGERNPGQFVLTLPCYIRQEAAEQPPAPVIVTVDLSTRQREQYDELERELLVWLDTHDKGQDVLVADLPIVLRSRLRTATLAEMAFDQNGDVNFAVNCESSKLTALRGVLDFWGAQPVLIYTDSKRFAKVTVARMRAAGYSVAEWSGDVTSKERDQIKARYLAGEIQYIVAVIAAFSTGLDGFQRVTNKIVWLSESESGMVNDQAVARAFRPGMTSANGGFQHVSIQARDTYDENIFGRLLAARLNMGQTLKVAA